jgi:imidazoleglycerol-phosphate dehydratase/histidinol-phosphatase
MSTTKFLFIDRDGTLIAEPADKQIDAYGKFQLLSGAISACRILQDAGYTLVMVSNQDGLGTDSFPREDFEGPQQLLLDILASEGVVFDAIYICPHLASDQCECRKPKVGLLMDYLREQRIDRNNSFVIGDRDSDVKLAENLGIKALQISETLPWPSICEAILQCDRTARVTRKTRETDITLSVNLDKPGPVEINTGIGFFDHMLEQIAKHGGFALSVNVKGDLEVDAHHTVEDTAIVLGCALKEALGDKVGVNRYGFLLPMDETLTHIALDCSGRAYCDFQADFTAETVGGLPTEMVPHFFQSLADNMLVTLHIKVQGQNNHHMVESCFKGLGRVFRQAFERTSSTLPSTKGTL